MGRHLVNEEIKERIYDFVGDDYTKLDEEYKNAHKKFSIRHNVCGYEYEVSWGKFQAGRRCPKCAGSLRLTNDQVVKRIYDLVGDEFTKLDDFYVNASTKFPIRHNICEHKYEVSWNNFSRGTRCPKCFGSKRLTNDQIVKRLYELVGDEYTKLDDVYIGALEKFPIRHNKCGHEYEVSWGNFLQGARCPRCANEMKHQKLKLSNEQIVKRIYDLVGSDYTKFDDVYLGSSYKFPIKHNKCGHEYKVSWANFQRGSRCPKCAYTIRKSGWTFSKRKRENNAKEID